MSQRSSMLPLVVFLAALAYLLLLRPYGFQLEDEGTLLFWFDRVSRGQQPYVDFHTGYTPGFFAFGQAVFALFGPSATALRGVLAVINALSAAGLAVAARRVAGPWFAPIPPLLWLAFMPVFTGEFAAFNVPYPTWPVTLCWVALALVMLRWIEVPRSSLLVAAGAACAAAMWLRPNSGAFALAATTWIVVAAAPRRSAFDRAAAPLAAAFMAAGVWYTFQFAVFGTDAAVHLLPAFAVAFILAGPISMRLAPYAGESRDAKTPGATASLALLAIAFLAPTLSWSLPLWMLLGGERFLYEVFLVGADYQSLYYKAHPSPEPFALLIVAGVLVMAAAGRLAARGRLRPLSFLLGFVVVAGLAKLVAFLRMVAPEGLVWSIVAQLENTSFWLAAAAGFGCAAWLWRVPAGELRSSPRARALLVAAPLGIAMYMQMYPRSDFMHQIAAVPLAAVAACGLLDRVARWWGRARWPEGWNGEWITRGMLLSAAVGMSALGLGEKLQGPLHALASAAPQTALPDRLDVHVEAAAGDELESIAQTVAFLRSRITPGEALWSFPATGGLLFAAGATNVAPHDYWYPGRPDRGEEARVLGILERERPRFIVTLNKGWNFFAGSPGYFENLRGFVGDRYRLAARFGRYDVLARADLRPAPEGGDAKPQTAALEAPAAAKGATSASAARDRAIEPNLERRRQAAWHWMEAMTPEEAAVAALPPDRRAALLLLRAIRDGGDLRAAGWMIAGFESGDARIRGEAVDAMVAATLDLEARRARLANDFDAAAWRPFVAPWAARARPLLALERTNGFARAVLELSGEPAATATGVLGRAPG